MHVKVYFFSMTKITIFLGHSVHYTLYNLCILVIVLYSNRRLRKQRCFQINLALMGIVDGVVFMAVTFATEPIENDC